MENLCLTMLSKVKNLGRQWISMVMCHVDHGSEDLIMVSGIAGAAEDHLWSGSRVHAYEGRDSILE